MKTLIIPDVHQEINKVKWVLKNEKFDKVIFLGDWFDSHDDPPKVAGFEETCKYLRMLLSRENPRREDMTFLVGNHDMNYIANNTGTIYKRHAKNNHYYASGYTETKGKSFRKTFWENNLRDNYFTENFKIAVIHQGWVISHAGFMPEHLSYGKSIEETINVQLPEVFKNFRQMDFSRNDLISGCGTYRGGKQAKGGVLWLDWDVEMEPSSIIGNQIVGHTSKNTPPVKITSDNGKITCWNMDTKGQHFGIIENGKVSYKEHPKVIQKEVKQTPTQNDEHPHQT